MPTLPVSSDAAQTPTLIPIQITRAFEALSNVIQGAQAVDWFGLGLTALGLLVVMLALGGIVIEETIQKPAREFVESGTAEKVVRLAKGG